MLELQIIIRYVSGEQGRVLASPEARMLILETQLLCTVVLLYWILSFYSLSESTNSADSSNIVNASLM